MGNGLLWPSEEAKCIFLKIPRSRLLHGLLWPLLRTRGTTVDHSGVSDAGLAYTLGFLPKDWLVVAVPLFPREDLHSEKWEVDSHLGNIFLMSLEVLTGVTLRSQVPIGVKLQRGWRHTYSRTNTWEERGEPGMRSEEGGPC